MYKKIPISKLTREEWLRLRKTGIGGSDAGAVCGLNTYVSAMDIFQNKVTDIVDFRDTEAQRIGRDLENYVAKRFAEVTGFKVRRSNFMYRSMEHPFMIADVDRLLVGEEAGLECKTANAFQAEQWKNGRVPLHYLMQVFHYMAVTGFKVWYLAVLILGQEFKYVKITWQEEMIRNLVQIEERFWMQHVLAGILPSPDGSEAFTKALEQYYGTVKKGAAIQLEGFDEKLDHRAELEEQIRKLEQEKTQIEQEIKMVMQDHEKASSKKYRITWAGVEQARLDVGRIKLERPEIYEEFVKVSGSRRFTVRAA